MRLRSGIEFVPYYLKGTFRPQTPLENPISTLVNVETLIQDAVAREDVRFEEGEDDSEGLGVTSRPPSPLTEIESEDEAEAPVQPHPQASSGLQSGAKRRRNDGAKKRRAKKRAKLASSGHQPHDYAAKPSTAAHHAEELKPLRVSADARDFSASGEGSWVGQRKSGAKREPWTVPELLEKDFIVIEWDGR
jgi:hypothetical protein